MKTLRVDLGPRGYDILIGKGLLANAGEYIRNVSAAKRAVIITDEIVSRAYLAPAARSLSAQGFSIDPVVIAPGEASKSFATLETVLENILALQPDRKTLIVALGGGVVGDIAGFAASILLRGVDFVQIPTTLLAQVDSSVGGKTGINSRHGKNLIGSFHQPCLVLADTATLETLDQRQRTAGYAEIVKCAAITDARFFDWLEANGAALLQAKTAALDYAIEKACALKARIVSEDERETGKRALLNFGHTFGHALEVEAGYGSGILHGEAVAIGMAMAAKLSVKLGLCMPPVERSLRAHLAAHGLPVTLPDALKDVPAAIFLDHMRGDKKAVGGKLTFILLRDMGDAFVSVDVPEGAVVQVIQDSIA